MRRCLLLLSVLLVLTGGAAWWFGFIPDEWLPRWIPASKEVRAHPQAKPDPQTYAVLVSELARWRAELSARHRAARSDAARAAVEHDARVLLETTMPRMMRCWLGTPWDFNGTAACPGGGKIACGYYVSTVIKDAGFQVNRYQLAQQSSQSIMRSFLDKDSCSLSIGKPYDDFVKDMNRAEPGIYLIGLDSHVAFLVVGGDGFRFIHSSGSKPWCVVDECSEEAEVLRRSKWRMIGNLTADRQVLRRWLKAEKILVHGV